MAVSLYTSRVVLDVLGVDDYGIYNIVGGVVVLFSIISNSMSSATQRFLTFALGGGDEEEVNRTFCMSMNCNFLYILLILLLAETIGVWFFNTQLNLPVDRIESARWLYQISVVTFLVSFARNPYHAAIIAHERMDFYAFISILEVVLKLLIVYLLIIVDYDKLLLYAWLGLAVSIIVSCIFVYYTKSRFKSFTYHYVCDVHLLKKMVSFSGYVMLGGVGGVASQQGGNILLNIYHNVKVNAAYGISNQISAAIYSFVSNFQVAFQPQIIKLYAQKKNMEMENLILFSSKISFYLLLIIAVPFIVNVDYILQLWLKVVPAYSRDFCLLMLVYFMIDAIQAPLWMAISATGNVRVYSIWQFGMLIFNIPISWFFLVQGFSPLVVLIVRVVLNFITAVIRTWYVRTLVEFSSFRYVKVVVIPSIIITFIALSLSLYVNSSLQITFLNFILLTVFYVFITILSVVLIGLNRNERHKIIGIIISKIKK